MTCLRCDLDLSHCHGLLVEHDDGTCTCLDGCGGPRAVHDEWVTCAELDLGCCEAAPSGHLGDVARGDDLAAAA